MKKVWRAQLQVLLQDIHGLEQINKEANKNQTMVRLADKRKALKALI